MNRSLTPLFRTVRRRLRVAWAVATAQLAAPLVAATALALVVAGRFLDMPWGDAAALWLAVAVAAAIVLYAAFCRVPDTIVARAADRGLQTRDAFSTSLELESADGEFPDRVHARARELAELSAPKQAVHYRLQRRPIVATAILAPAAIALALIANPQDAIRQREARDRAAIEATADVLQTEAERLAAQPGGEEAARRLQQLADELSRTQSLEKAEELLDQAAAELRSDIGQDLLSKTAATKGLQQSLENAPLPGAENGQSVQQQLDALAKQLSEMTAAQRNDAAQRLDDLAATQDAGDPATAQALRDAAKALRAGDVATAKARLGEAAAANAQAAADVDAQTAAGDAARAAADARDRLAQARDGDPTAGQGQGQGQGQGEGEGEGEGQGQGEGQGEGQGQGQGQGEGQGQGQGTGGAGGNPSGNVGGGSGSPGSGGQGGQGTGTGHTSGSGTPDTDTIYDPVRGTGGQTGTVGGGQGTGEGGTVGQTNGQTNSGTSWVPVSQAIDDYAREATDAMDNPLVPPSMRSLVLAYFNQLQGGR